ncbi:MAG: ParB-like nuclease domain-containing protein, partial [Clostridia bacterium]|nr:ParB-like nuclease domain-containing protein [Clostridia bacterium]
PARYPLSLFTRCAGPEENMKYRIDKDWWDIRIAELEKAVQAGRDMPPFIVHYVDGAFELNDGNHRHKVCENLGIDTVWAIVWITEEDEFTEFMEKYGEYAKGCTVVRR